MVDRDKGRSEVILATILTGSGTSQVALLESPGYQRMTTSVHYLVMDSGIGEKLGSGVRWELDQLGLPTEALKYALEPPDIATLVKARFLNAVARSESTSQILFVDETCWMHKQPETLEMDGESTVQLFRDLDELTVRIPSAFAHAASPGDEPPTGDVIRLRGDDERLASILQEWDARMLDRYLANPMTVLRNDETTYLAELRATRSAVSWGDPDTYASVGRIASSREVAILGTRYVADLNALSSRDLVIGEPLAAIARWVSHPKEEPVSSRFGEVARSVYRAVDPMGHRWSEPGEGFAAWLEEQDSSGMSRIARSAYWTRGDLQESFSPDETPADVFDEWFRRVALGRDTEGSTIPGKRVGRAVARITRKLSRQRVSTIASSRRPPTGVNGVNIVGFLTAATGLGSAARSTGSAFARMGVKVAHLDLSDRIQTGRVSDVPSDVQGVPFDTTIFHINPEELIGYAPDSLAYRIGTGWNVGFFFWETDRIPETWIAGISAVDEIWVGSTFVADSFKQITSKPVRIVGLPVEPSGTTRSRRSGDSVFTVSYVADLGSGAERKNPVAAVRAFRRAFGDDPSETRLVMKLGNLDRNPGIRAQLGAAAEGMPVEIVEGYVSRERVRALIEDSDVYLSLHRSEGLGLTLLEAMEMGVPVVATGYGGNTDFMTSDSGRLVNFRIVEAGQDAGPYIGHRWAEPDIDHAALHLRELQADPELRMEIGARGRSIVAADYSVDVFAARVTQAINDAGVVLSPN
jgi:glycosyltransferase involved in cell wall biosynthesis